MALHLHRMKKVTAPIAWVLVLMLAFFPIGRHAAGVVLCIEQDGRVAVEDAVDKSCGTHVSAPLPSLPAQTSFVEAGEGGAHCDDCIDIFVPSGSDLDCASFVVARTIDLPVDLATAAPVSLPSLAAPVVLRPAAGPAPFPVPDPTPLRSVVLLI